MSKRKQSNPRNEEVSPENPMDIEASQSQSSSLASPAGKQATADTSSNLHLECSRNSMPGSGELIFRQDPFPCPHAPVEHHETPPLSKWTRGISSLDRTFDVDGNWRAFIRDSHDEAKLAVDLDFDHR